jgi:hypothetical protein
MSARQRLFTAGVTSIVVALTMSVRAADVQGTRVDLKERQHLIEVRLDRGSATFVVTRTVENLGPKGDQASFAILVPEGAVATRLRSRGMAPDGSPRWFEADLVEAVAAGAKYTELASCT